MSLPISYHQGLKYRDNWIIKYLIAFLKTYRSVHQIHLFGGFHRWHCTFDPVGLHTLPEMSFVGLLSFNLNINYQPMEFVLQKSAFIIWAVLKLDVSLAFHIVLVPRSGVVVFALDFVIVSQNFLAFQLYFCTQLLQIRPLQQGIFWCKINGKSRKFSILSW